MLAKDEPLWIFAYWNLALPHLLTPSLGLVSQCQSGVFSPQNVCGSPCQRSQGGVWKGPHELWRVVHCGQKGIQYVWGGLRCAVFSGIEVGCRIQRETLSLIAQPRSTSLLRYFSREDLIRDMAVEDEKLHRSWWAMAELKKAGRLYQLKYQRWD